MVTGHFRNFRLALTFLFTFGLCVASPTGVAVAEPFKTTGSSHIGSESGVPPFTLSSGSAIGIMIGRSSFGGLLAVSPFGFPPPCGAGFFSTISGPLDLKAANGDHLYLDFTADNCQSAMAPASFQANGTYTITGGTRRFQDATGSGSFSSHSVFDTGPGLGARASGTWDFSVNGTLDR